MRRTVSQLGIAAILALLCRPSSGSPSDPFNAGVPTYDKASPKGAQYDQGDHGVSAERGAATYSFPIVVPPGRKGMAPHLAFTYSSQAPVRGGLAVGWSFDIPSIRLDNALPSVGASPRYRETLTNGTLIRVDADVKSFSSLGTTYSYRDELDDSYARFEKIESGTSQGWVARTTDGVTHWFLQTTTTSDGITRWNLTSEVDPWGNEVDYVWEQAPLPAPGQVDYRIKQILYTKNVKGTNNLLPQAKIDFVYAALDLCGSYVPIGASSDNHAGQKNVYGSSRLLSITMSVQDNAQVPSGWRQVRQVTLAYDATALSCTQDAAPLRYLTSITESATSPTGVLTTMPSVTFTYGPKTVPTTYVTPSAVSTPAYPDSGSPDGAQTMLLDMNGDGMQDLVSVGIGPSPDYKCRMTVYAGLFGGGFGPASTLDLPTAPWQGSVPNTQEKCDLNGQLTLNVNRPTHLCTVHWGTIISYHFVDYDADGLVDLATNIWQDDRNFLGYYAPSPFGPDPNPSCPVGEICGPNWQPMPSPPCDDSYGDQRPEVINANRPPPSNGFYTPGNYVLRVFKNIGGSFASSATFVYPQIPLPTAGAENHVSADYVPTTSIPTLTDINGDGFLDMVDTGIVASGTHSFGDFTYMKVYAGHGTSQFDALPNWNVPVNVHPGAPPGSLGGPPGSSPMMFQTAIRATTRDVNGDGLPDLVEQVATPSANTYAFLNNGSGFDITSPPGSGLTPNYLGVNLPLEWIQTDVATWSSTDTMATGDRGNTYRLFDVDGDGLTDLLVLPTDQTGHPYDASFHTGSPQVYFNVGDYFLPPRSLATVWFDAERLFQFSGGVSGSPHVGTWHVSRDVSDRNGDGLPDLVEDTGTTSTLHVQDLSGGPPRLLASVNNGRGSTVTYSYAASTDPSVVTINSTYVFGPRQTRPMWVVKLVTVAPGFGQPSMWSSYKYEGPMFGDEANHLDASGHPDRPGQFLGFRETTIESSAPAGAPSGTKVFHDFTYTLSAFDHRGHEITTRTQKLLSGSWALASYTSTAYLVDPLFDGATHTTHVDTVTSCTQQDGLSDCNTTGSNQHVAKTTYAVYPATGPVELYTPLMAYEGPSTALFEKRKAFAYEVRYTTGPDYRILLDSTEASRWVSGAWTFTGFSSTNYDGVTGLPTQTNLQVDGTSAGVGNLAVTARTFDAYGNVASVTKPVQFTRSAPKPTTTYTYEPNLIFVNQTTNELFQSTFATIDTGTGGMTSKKGPNVKTVLIGGQYRQVWDEEDWTIDGFGRVLTHSTDVDDPTYGYASYVIDTNTYTDSSSLNMVSEAHLRDIGGSVWVTTEHRFDGIGRVISDTKKRFISGQPDAVTSYYYDQAGSLASVTEPDPRFDTGTIVTYSYTRDPLGRTTQFTRPDGTGSTISYLGLSKTITEVVTDGSGGVSSGTFDIYGRLTQTSEFDNPTAGNTATTAYQYDDQDRLVQITDAESNVTLQAFDIGGRKIQISRGTRVWKYGYDLNGNMISKESPLPAGGLDSDYTTTTTYDDLDRIRVKSPARRGMVPSRQTQLGIGDFTYTYDSGTDAIGELTGITLPFGSATYAYEARGLVSQETRSFNVSYLASASASQTIYRTYNALRLPTLVNYEDAGLQRWQTTYDARGLEQAVQWWDGAAWRSVADYGTRALAGAPRSRTTDAIYNQRRDWTFDVMGRAVTDNVKWSSTTRSARTYAYFQSGDLSSISGQTDGTNAAATFSYDKTHRLLHATGPSSYNGTFTYSKTGNVLTANVSYTGGPNRNVSYTYGATDPQAVDTLTNIGPGTNYARFFYDVSGDTKERDTPSGTWTYTWDGEDNLRESSGPSPTFGTEAYYYDEKGNRVLAMNAVDGVRFWFQERLTQFPVGGGAQTKTVYLADGSGALARLTRVGTGTPTMELSFADALQSLALSMNQAGTPTATFLYGAFGEVVSSTGATDHRRQFNGKENDARTELRYYGARYYDALSLRWTSSDPFSRFAPEFSKTSPQRTNLYSFSENNPLRYFDPDGRDPKRVNVLVVGNYDAYLPSYDGTYKHIQSMSSPGKLNPQYAKALTAMMQQKFPGETVKVVAGETPKQQAAIARMNLHGGSMIIDAHSNNDGVVLDGTHGVAADKIGAMVKNSGAGHVELFNCKTANGDDNYARDVSKAAGSGVVVRGYSTVVNTDVSWDAKGNYTVDEDGSQAGYKEYKGGEKTDERKLQLKVVPDADHPQGNDQQTPM